ncbi:MAG: DUF2938 domain-containing protein [Gemmatimonadaceae bacterium]|nr:DUF2938 domain-containing protein [Gemmatimonadaceae bacterium]
MDHLLHTITIGVTATAAMDVWGVARRPLFGFARPDYALVGRWFAHMPRGRFRHESIAAARPVYGERLIGWTAHYAIGLSFAALLIGLGGDAWLQHPTIGPALLVGVGTVAAPLLLMQPGMGAGVAASRTPNPAAARLQSLISHTIFGLGLYLGGWASYLLSSLAR